LNNKISGIEKEIDDNKVINTIQFVDTLKSKNPTSDGKKKRSKLRRKRSRSKRKIY
jgi:hypothetical protein